MLYLPSNTPPTSSRNRRRAMVILAVLVVVVILSLAAYRYADLMTQQYAAAENVVKSAQSKCAAKSGVNYVAMMMANAEARDFVLQGNWFDNMDQFHLRPIIDVEDETFRRGYFSIVSPPHPDDFSFADGYYRFGLTDESSKINLNAMMKVDKSGDDLYNMLLGLPSMRTEVAAAIVDWLDADDEPRPGGAESQLYTQKQPGYWAKNGPIDSLDELLLVEGVYPEDLYGGDINRNGMIDANEQIFDDNNPLGWQAYLTIYSREQNVYYVGPQSDMPYLPKINLNGQDLVMLYEELSALDPALAAYIVVYRVHGGRRIREEDLADTEGEVLEELPEDIDLENPKRLRKIRSIYDLVNTKVDVKIGEGKDRETITYLSPLNDFAGQEALFPLLFEYATTSDKTEFPGRININTAPEPVLYALAGLGLEVEDAEIDDSSGTSGTSESSGASSGSGSSGSSDSSGSDGGSDSGEEEAEEGWLSREDIDAILACRPFPGEAQDDPAYDSPAWLITMAGISPRNMRRLEPYITTKSQVYRFQVLGYFETTGPMTRVEAVIDTNAGRPRILHYRDLTLLGKGFDLGLGN